MIGTQDLVLGALIVFVLFGAKRLPELMGALGKSIKEFKKGVEESTGPAAPVLGVARTCGSCQAPLEAEWQHCPRCGSAAPSRVSQTP